MTIDRYCIVLFCGQEFTSTDEPAHYHRDKPEQNTYVKIDKSSPVSVACAANHRHHSDLQSCCTLGDMYMSVGSAFHPTGPRIICMFVSVTMLKSYLTTGYFRDRCHKNTKGEYIKHLYEFFCGPPEELAKDDFGGRPPNVDFIWIIDFEEARKRYKSYQAKRTLIWNMFLSYCDGDGSRNMLEVDLIVGMYSIAKKSIVYYYAPSKPATWFQSFPVNIGACGRFGCPQVYNISYIVSWNTAMDGGLVGDIVDNVRKSNWMRSARIGMLTLTRPETICLDRT